MKKILGIDCGWSKPGFALVEIRTTAPGTVVYSECFETHAMAGKQRKKLSVKKYADDARRVIELSDKIAEVCSTYRPDVVVVEMPTSGGQSASALKGMCMGAATLVATLRRVGITPIMITPTQNKHAAGGDKELEKQRVVDSVKAVWPDYAGWPRMKKYKDRFDNESCWAIADALSCILTVLQMPESEESAAMLIKIRVSAAFRLLSA